MVELYAQARRMVAVEMETDAIEPEVLPMECPYSVDEVLEAEWLPQNVYDLDRDEFLSGDRSHGKEPDTTGRRRAVRGRLLSVGRAPG